MGGRDGSKSNRQHPAATCLAVDTVVSGWWLPSEKQKKYRKKLPRAVVPLPLLASPCGGQAASGPVHLQAPATDPSSRGPALSSLLSTSTPGRESLLALEKACNFFAPQTFSWRDFLCTGVFGWCGWLVIFPQLLFGSCARAPYSFLLLPVDSVGRAFRRAPSVRRRLAWGGGGLRGCMVRCVNGRRFLVFGSVP